MNKTIHFLKFCKNCWILCYDHCIIFCRLVKDSSFIPSGWIHDSQFANMWMCIEILSNLTKFQYTPAYLQIGVWKLDEVLILTANRPTYHVNSTFSFEQTGSEQLWICFISLLGNILMRTRIKNCNKEFRVISENNIRCNSLFMLLFKALVCPVEILNFSMALFLLFTTFK